MKKNDLSDSLKLQAGRGERIEEQRYGVQIDIVKHLSMQSMETFQQLSRRWHQFLGLISDKQEEEQQQQQLIHHSKIKNE